jgi:hypothetical protein
MEQEILLVIEGKERRWARETITAEEIVALGEWDLSEGVMGLGHDGAELPIKSGEAVHVAHHKSFERLPFVLVIEGKTRGWHRETITVAEIAGLGGWDVAVGVIEVDEETNDERQLAPGEEVPLHHHRHHNHHHHHKSFGKKHRWKRG